MKQVLKVSDLIQNEKKEVKGIELTHFRNAYQETWLSKEDYLKDSVRDLQLSVERETLIHLGYCRKSECDLFMCDFINVITFYKGHLNDGTY